jgi:2-phospho-L-lactate/phosphoenolpyruvate guanylyltransferase
VSVRIIAVPVKALGRSKSRLSRVCSPLERAALTLAMFEDVLDATLAVHGWETWVISPDEAVLEVAVRRRARAVFEGTPSLLGAVRQVDEEATERAADALAIVLGDTPLLSAPELSDALRTLGPIVLAPAADGLGTNVLLRRPPRAIRPRFGPESFAKHRGEAARKHLPVSVVHGPGLAFDLDGPDDILTLLDAGVPGRTRDVCMELDLGSRIRVDA